VKLGKRFRFPATRALSRSPQQLGHQFNDAVIEDVFIGVVALDVAVVRAPSHPFWLWRQVPFIWIAIADQARLDPCLARVRATVWPKELRSIGDLPPSPGLTAAKSFCTRRHPKHRCSPVHDGADEVPLRPTDMSYPRAAYRTAAIFQLRRALLAPNTLHRAQIGNRCHFIGGALRCAVGERLLRRALEDALIDRGLTNAELFQLLERAKERAGSIQ
jgi:hypothetical protein